MNELSNTIYAYYCEHFDELTFDKQLHFASRLLLWSGDDFGRQKLQVLRPAVTASESPVEALGAVYARGIETIHHGSKNAAELRAPYFARYPQLRVLAMVLFRLTFLKTIYGLDARAAFFKLFPADEVEAMLLQLQADPEALAMLSTHAVNVLYLYDRIVRGSDELFDPALFLAVGAKQYELHDPIQLQLYIYLYTHCIIGESHFYARAIPERHQPVYDQMLDELTNSITNRFDFINLDNKCEYLVCCKLLNRTSVLEARIFDEAAQSVSDSGTYLVDRHNQNPQLTNATFDLSEHRNVLYILANRPFRPGLGGQFVAENGPTSLTSHL